MNNHRGADETRLIVRVLARSITNVAREEIATAHAALRTSGTEGGAGNSTSVRQLRIALRRAEYELSAMSDLDSSLEIDVLLRNLHEIGRPLGELRDLEVLEQRVAKALGHRAASFEGRELEMKVAEERREAERLTDVLLVSPSFRHVVGELDDYRLSLPTSAVSPAMARPVVQEAVRLLWRSLRHAAKKARNDDSDENLHALRQTVKRTVYLTRAFSYVLGPSSEEFTLRLVALQKILGRQHDHVVVASWLEREADSDEHLHELMHLLAKEERGRADGYKNHWVRYWKSVRDLRPNDSVLTTYSFFDT